MYIINRSSKPTQEYHVFKIIRQQTWVTPAEYIHSRSWRKQSDFNGRLSRLTDFLKQVHHVCLKSEQHPQQKFQKYEIETTSLKGKLIAKDSGNNCLMKRTKQARLHSDVGYAAADVVSSRRCLKIDLINLMTVERAGKCITLETCPISGPVMYVCCRAAVAGQAAEILPVLWQAILRGQWLC